MVAAAALGVAALGAHTVSAVLLVVAVVGVTFAFGLGQPALMEAVGDAVADDVRGVALGIATLFFLVGGGVGSAVVGGLGDVLGMAPRCCSCARAAAGRARRAGAAARAPTGSRTRRLSRRPRGAGCHTSPRESETVAGPLAASSYMKSDCTSTPLRTMTPGQKPTKDRSLGLSTAQVTGSALAAMSGAFFVSWAGYGGHARSAPPSAA